MITGNSHYYLCKRCNARISIWPLLCEVMLPTHTDFFQGNLESIRHALSICPKCYFVGYNNDFLPLNSSNEEEIYDELAEEEGNRDKVPPTKRFVMLAERFESEGMRKFEIGNCYLCASWIERHNFEPNEVITSPETESDGPPPLLCLTLQLECVQQSLRR